MECQWLKLSPGLIKGINIINVLDDTRFEYFIRHIVTKLKQQDSDIFSEEEKLKLTKVFKLDEENLSLAIKTILYLYKRLLKFIFMPNNLKNDLKQLGFSNEKSDFIVKVWSTDAKTTLNDLGNSGMEKNKNEHIFSWKLNAELSSDIRKKSKVPKAYLEISDAAKDVEIEMTHPELYSLYLQLEAVQNELDNIL